MLSLVCIVGFLVCLTQAQYGGHSPILGGNRVTGYSQHGDHIDAHVHSNVVGPYGNVQTVHREVPLGHTVGMGGYNNGYNRRRWNTGYNGYGNNMFRQPYMTSNTGGFFNGGGHFGGGHMGGGHMGHGHGGHGIFKRAALLPVARYPTNELFRNEANLQK